MCTNFKMNKKGIKNKSMTLYFNTNVQMSSWTTFFSLIIFLVLSPYILSLHLENRIMIIIVIQLKNAET